MADPVNQDSKDPQSIIGAPSERTITLERAAIKVNEEERTVELCFSTENPVERWYGFEILDHSPGAADLRRLNKGGPVLLCHDRSQQAGACVKGTARVDDDRKGRATVKFSRSQLGTDTMHDVQDEIRTQVSVRYIPRRMILEKSDKEKGDTYRVTKWEALEISFEPIEADTSCGVGRGHEATPEEVTEFKQRAAEMGIKLAADDNTESDAERVAEQTTTEVRTTMADKNETETVAQPTAERAALVRAQEMREFGELFGDEGRELALTHIADGKSLDDLKRAISEKRKTAQSKSTPPAEEPGASAARNGSETQLARVQSRVQLRAFKGEHGARTAHRFGNFLNAALFNKDEAREYCRENGIAIQRAQSESDNETGGFLVPTEFENVMIDLRLEYGVFRRNANVVPMAGLRKERPRRKGGLTAYPIGARGENRRLTESKKNWDLVGLDAKKWGVLAKYEEELSDDSVIGMADDLASEIAYAFTQVEDECGFLGDGSSTYHGITGVIPKLTGLSGTVANIAGLQVASGNAWSEITKEDILAVVGKLPSFARKTGMVKWYCSNEFWATVLCRIALSLGGVAVAEIQKEIAPSFLGKPVEIVEVMPHVEANSQVALLYGNLAQGAMFGDRKGVTVKMTDSNDTDFEEDLMAIKGTERFDINVHDVGNAHATASQRKAGPIVGLITAAA